MLIVVAGAMLSAASHAQDRPFLYTMTFPDHRVQPLVIHYDAAYGRETFEPFGADRVEQAIGLQTGVSEFVSLDAHMGLALDGRSSRTSQQAELFAHVLKADDHLIDLSAGAGVRHEYSGTNVLLARIVAGRRFSSWQIYGNLLLEKAMSRERDDIDLITTFGLSYHVSTAIRFGIEAVGQDLEGFWDENEAEGGATLFLGPAIGYMIPETPWSLTVGGGVIMHASKSIRTTDATRDLPLGKQNGFVIRTMLSFSL